MCYSVKKDGTISGDLADRQQLKLLEGTCSGYCPDWWRTSFPAMWSQTPTPAAAPTTPAGSAPTARSATPAAVEGRRSYKMMDAQRFWEEIGKEMGDHGG